MSYTPDNQRIYPSTRDSFYTEAHRVLAVIDARIASGDWTEEHLRDCRKARKRIERVIQFLAAHVEPVAE
jgi:hypothetical protein